LCPLNLKFISTPGGVSIISNKLNPKTKLMKRTTTLICLSFLLKVAFPQAQGTFTYQTDYSGDIATGKVITKNL
jgi:hypothetical protein